MTSHTLTAFNSKTCESHFIETSEVLFPQCCTSNQDTTVGPSQDAKGSPWRHASSRSSCLVRRGGVRSALLSQRGNQQQEHRRGDPLTSSCCAGLYLLVPESPSCSWPSGLQGPGPQRELKLWGERQVYPIRRPCRHHHPATV